jgi:hypothetical protein
MTSPQGWAHVYPEADYQPPCSPPEEQLPRGVKRHEYNRTRGYLVRCYRLEEGISTCYLRRLFSDGAYGGRAAARAAALECHAQHQVAREKKRTNGYGYVRCERVGWKTATGECRSYLAWRVYHWDDEGKFTSTKWSIDQHGSDEAKRRCEEWLDAKRGVITEAV